MSKPYTLSTSCGPRNNINFCWTLLAKQHSYDVFLKSLCFMSTRFCFEMKGTVLKLRIQYRENLHPNGLVLLNVTSSGKFHTKICLSSALRFAACVNPSSNPFNKKKHTNNVHQHQMAYNEADIIRVLDVRVLISLPEMFRFESRSFLLWFGCCGSYILASIIEQGCKRRTWFVANKECMTLGYCSPWLIW